MENLDPETTGETAPSKPVAIPLKERASKTVKVLWTGVGALATLGGVVGLVQVFSANNSGSLPAGASSQDVLMEMVKSGDIEVEDAERLAELLYGENGSTDTQGLKDIAESGTDRQKKAIAMMAERHTRDEGLSLLEAEAKSGADWRLVAELSYGFDPERALAAVKKAIALDPEDFRAVTLMSQVQVQTGDFSSAQRSAKTAELLATTTIERVMSTRSSLSILMSASNVSDIPAGIDSLKSAIEPNKLDVETTPLPTRFEEGRDAEIHPLYIQAVSHETIAAASLYVADYTSAKFHAERAVEDFQMITPLMPSEAQANMKSRIARLYDNLIYAEFIAKNWPEVTRLSGEQLEMYRGIAETGDKRAQANLPGHYARYAGYAAYTGDKDIVRSASRRAVDLSQLAADRRPDDVRLALNVGQMELNTAILLQSIGDDIDISASFDKMMTGLEEALRGTPDEAKNSPWTRYSNLLSSVVGYFARDDIEFKSDPREEVLSRAEVFLDAEIASRPEAHDPRHARNSLYLLRGIYLASSKDMEGARKAYQRAYDDAVNITPTETEPDVVVLSEFVALQHIVALEEEGVEAVDKPELKQAIELGQRLDREGKLTTPYQSVLSYLIATRDGTLPDYEAAQGR